MYLYIQISSRSSNIRYALKFHGGTSDLSLLNTIKHVPTCKQLQNKTPVRFVFARRTVLIKSVSFSGVNDTEYLCSFKCGYHSYRPGKSEVYI